MRKINDNLKGESPKAVLQAAKLQAYRERLERARGEDAVDAAWMRECNRLWRKTAKETALTGFDLIMEVAKAVPPHPPGWFLRRANCNRCGSSVERDEQHDALCCRTCRRWLEPRCGDPNCQFCQNRPSRPQGIEE